MKVIRVDNVEAKEGLDYLSSLRIDIPDTATIMEDTLGVTVQIPASYYIYIYFFKNKQTNNIEGGRFI